MKITDSQIKLALLKMYTTPYSLVNDSIEYRIGYLRALQDMGIIDGLTATRMMLEITNKKGWES